MIILGATIQHLDQEVCLVRVEEEKLGTPSKNRPPGATKAGAAPPLAASRQSTSIMKRSSSAQAVASFVVQVPLTGTVSPVATSADALAETGSPALSQPIKWQ